MQAKAACVETLDERSCIGAQCVRQKKACNRLAFTRQPDLGSRGFGRGCAGACECRGPRA